jgi:putative CocE/NonD family hydrolase
MVDALSVLGPVKLVLYASTSARDTDFVADLYDVGPDGRDIRVVYRTAILRTRYREGYDRQVPMQPDVSERLELKFFHVGHVFRPGHRIRIEISSSAPGISPNQNTGNDVGTDTQWTVARQRIFHDATRPSHLELPTVDATSLRPTATLNEAPEARR